MTANQAESNILPEFDPILQTLTDYVLQYRCEDELAISTAYYDLLDSLSCSLLALPFPECKKHLGPIVPEQYCVPGAKVPGTHWQLDPVQAAFNIGTLIRWLDFNDTWLAAEWGHPSDNIGGLLAIMDYQNRRGKANFTVADLLQAMIKAHEIQGVLALENSFNQVGLDHVVLVKVATTAVVTQLLGGNREQILNALSLAWVDGQSLRTYRHAPNTGTRKSWAAGDATSRGVRLALMAMQGEMGYPSVLSAKDWGFYDVLFQGKSFELARTLDCYVMKNVLFKIAFPAEFHAQTAVECAIALHAQVKPRLAEIKQITIHTQEPAIRIISKTGPLHNAADRDHCLQFMVAVALLYGKLTAEHYQDNVAQDPRIEVLRELMQVQEDPAFTKDYYDPEKRAIPNAIEIEFKDGTHTELVSIAYPIGHRRRREEGIPLLLEKFTNSLTSGFAKQRARDLNQRCLETQAMHDMPVHDFVDLFTH